MSEEERKEFKELVEQHYPGLEFLRVPWTGAEVPWLTAAMQGDLIASQESSDRKILLLTFMALGHSLSEMVFAGPSTRRALLVARYRQLKERFERDRNKADRTARQRWPYED